MKKKYLLPLILLLLSLLTFYRLCRSGYFSMMDDMHVFRLQQFDQCFKDSQIPCRLISDGGMGYGYPLFNYYSPLSYSIAEGFHLIGFSLINSLKITFALCHIIGIFGMYLFAGLFWGNLGGFISAVIFLFAPYQATDSWVRGAIAESLAINIIPWVFYFLTKFIKNLKLKIKDWILLTVSLTALLLSHNLISLAIAPILVIYSLILLIKNKKINLKSLFTLSIPVLSSLGLSAFFILPAIFEKNLVTVDTMTQDYFQYIIHFATLNQLFISRFWGYGASLWGPIDDMAFSIGIVQWLLPLIIIVFIFFKKIFKKRYPELVEGQTIFIFFFFIIFLFSVFLTHNKSTFIWQTLHFMAYFQFPWRFLSIAIFSASFISGSIILILNKKIQKIALIFITTITIILNISYFKEDIWYFDLTDQQKLSTENILAQSGAGLKDYWPKYSQNFPTSFAPNLPIVIQGKVDFIKYFKKSNYSEAYYSVSTPKATINLPITYFPNWELYVDGQKTDYQIDPDLGLIQFETNQGEHNIKLYFKNTPVRKIANVISLLTLCSLVAYGIKLSITKDEK